tara:strand:- start:641 stop:1132 length:492 start_codon:yes stop_codon:yes gene_type:complete
MLYTIYRISIAGESYIGSTINLKQRKQTHKSCCNSLTKYNVKLYKFIRENGGFESCQITTVELYECASKREAEEREEHWRRGYKASLNTKQAYVTEEEKAITVKINNDKRYDCQSINCECGGKYRPQHKQSHFKSIMHKEYIKALETAKFWEYKLNINPNESP